MYCIFLIGNDGIRHIFTYTPHEDKAREVAITYSECHETETEIFDTDTCQSSIVSASGLVESNNYYEIDIPSGTTADEAYIVHIPLGAKAEVWTINGDCLALDYGATHDEYYDNYLVSRIEGNEDETHFRIYVQEE